MESCREHEARLLHWPARLRTVTRPATQGELVSSNSSMIHRFEAFEMSGSVLLGTDYACPEAYFLDPGVLQRLLDAVDLGASSDGATLAASSEAPLRDLPGFGTQPARLEPDCPTCGLIGVVLSIVAGWCLTQAATLNAFADEEGAVNSGTLLNQSLHGSGRLRRN